MSDNQLVLRGVLKGHNGWVTSIATSTESPDTILSGSRGFFFLFHSLKCFELKHQNFLD